MSGTREESEARLASIAAEIGKALGGWRATLEHGHMARLRHPSDRDLEVSLSVAYPHGAKGRVECAGILPWKRGNELRVYSKAKAPRITVALSRAPEDIAAEICRRALPGYLEAMATLRKDIAEAEEALDARTKLVRRLAEVVGAVQVGEGRIYLPDDVCSYGHVEVGSGGGSVKLDVSMSPEQAEAVLRALRALAKRTS